LKWISRGKNFKLERAYTKSIIIFFFCDLLIFEYNV